MSIFKVLGAPLRFIGSAVGRRMFGNVLDKALAESVDKRAKKTLLTVAVTAIAVGLGHIAGVLSHNKKTVAVTALLIAIACLVAAKFIW